MRTFPYIAQSKKYIVKVHRTCFSDPMEDIFVKQTAEETQTQKDVCTTQSPIISSR